MYLWTDGSNLRVFCVNWGGFKLIYEPGSVELGELRQIYPNKFATQPSNIVYSVSMFQSEQLKPAIKRKC